jgi:hypothetical protein
MDPPLERLEVGALGLFALAGRGRRCFGGGHGDDGVGYRLRKRGTSTGFQGKHSSRKRGKMRRKDGAVILFTVNQKRRA